MNQYSILLDKVYELEGLLHLAVNRDNPPATLDVLIRRKAVEITSEIAELPVSEVTEADEPDIAYDSDPCIDSDPSGEPAPGDETDDIYDDDESYEEYDESDAEYVADTEDTDGEADDDSDGEPDDKELPAPKKFAFSINDRFRFRRTLFDNSDRKFNVAVASVSACHSYEDAEQMLVEDYGWNSEDIEVADFMRLVSNYFKYRR